MSLRIKFAAFTSAMLVSGGMGVALAAPAFAVDNQVLCVHPSNGVVNVSYCANPTGSNAPGLNVYMEANSLFTWNVPPKSGQISTSDGGSPKECMEVNAKVHNAIFLEPCKGKASEEWKAIGKGKGNVEYKNKGDGLCLNTKDDANHSLNAAKCNGGTNQLFFGAAG
jgi:hypothetical protein